MLKNIVWRGCRVWIAIFELALSYSSLGADMTYRQFLSAGRCTPDECVAYAMVAACSYKDEWNQVPEGYELVSKWGVEGYLEGNRHFRVAEDGEITSDPHYTKRKPTRMQARILHGPRGEVVISFRGTDALSFDDDLGDDLLICKGKLPIQCNDAARLLHLVLKHSDGAEIIVVGHSLGGCLAQCAIAANDCHARKVSGYVFNSMGIPQSTVNSFDKARLKYANACIVNFQLKGDRAIGLAKLLLSIFKSEKMQTLGITVSTPCDGGELILGSHRAKVVIDCLKLGR